MSEMNPGVIARYLRELSVPGSPGDQAADAIEHLERERDLFKARLDWLLDDYRAVDLYNTAVGVLGTDGKQSRRDECYAAIDSAITKVMPAMGANGGAD